MTSLSILQYNGLLAPCWSIWNARWNGKMTSPFYFGWQGLLFTLGHCRIVSSLASPMGLAEKLVCLPKGLLYYHPGQNTSHWATEGMECTRREGEGRSWDLCVCTEPPCCAPRTDLYGGNASSRYRLRRQQSEPGGEMRKRVGSGVWLGSDGIGAPSWAP